VEFAEKKTNFANDSDWMHYFNPEWTDAGK